MTPLEDQLSRARAWIAWFMGGLRVSTDFLETGRELLRLYVETARLCTTRELAERSLAAGWCWSEQQDEPASHDDLFECWAARERVPCRSLTELTAHVGALYLMCVEGRLPKEQALALGELWEAPGELLSGRRVLPRGGATS